MNAALRFAGLISSGIALLCSTTPVATAAGAASVTTSVNASNVKPLIIAKLTDLDLGSVTLAPGSWTSATVSISQAGVLTCTNANLTCTGATSVASYNVQGSKQQVVNISAPDVTLVNQADSTKTLTLTTDAPSTLVLANSGFPGSNFSVGGSVTVDSTTAAGTYVGTFNVTVDY
jgi:spore coat protein U-like protein